MIILSYAIESIELIGSKICLSIFECFWRFGTVLEKFGHFYVFMLCFNMFDYFRVFLKVWDGSGRSWEVLEGLGRFWTHRRSSGDWIRGLGDNQPRKRWVHFCRYTLIYVFSDFQFFCFACFPSSLVELGCFEHASGFRRPQMTWEIIGMAGSHRGFFRICCLFVCKTLIFV